jgi:phosphoribosylformimino-5-aminoimidazole carboxamide ribotide isomerase
VIAVPAVDIKGGRCVQLVGGDPGAERIALQDPVGVAKHWVALGFATLHVVDLDAALGSGSNRAIVERILAATSEVSVQVGGGIRDDEAVTAFLAAGADRVIIGTRAVSDPNALAALVERHPGRVMVAADVRQGRLLRHGWQESVPLDLDSFLERLRGLEISGLLWTDVGREGQMCGVDARTAGRVIARSPVPVWVAGGIATLEDLRALRAVGAAGAVLGMALYTGRLDPRRVVEEFGR